MSGYKGQNTILNNDQGGNIKREILKYLRYWYWYVIGVFIALICAFIYLRYTPKIYKAEAKIKILNKTKGLELPSSAFVFNRSNINLENEIEILKSQRIIESVVDQLDFNMKFYREGNVIQAELLSLPFNITKTINDNDIKRNKSYTIEIAKNAFEVKTDTNSDEVLAFPDFDTREKTHNLPFELSIHDGYNVESIVGNIYRIELLPVASVARGIKGNVQIGPIGKNSDLLKLSYTSGIKLKNEKVLNTLIDVFNQDGINDRQDISRRTIQFIDERFTLLASQLDSIESGIKDFKQRNNLVTVESDAELGITQRSFTEKEIFEVENQITILNLLKESLKNPNGETDLLPANIGIGNSNVNSGIDDFNKLVLERDNLKSSAGNNNPGVKLIDEKLKGLKSNILSSIDSYAIQLQSTKQSLEKKNRKFASQVYSLPAKEKVVNEITRQQAIKQSLYLFLLQKREEAAINLAITEPSIKVVEYAISKGAPISPNSKQTYLMSAFLGVAIPFGIIYLILFLNTKITNREDLSNACPEIPIVGEIPELKKKVKEIFRNPNDTTTTAEAFRILAANINYTIPVDHDSTSGKIIYCTSTIKGEGKTYVSLNLSLALSSINKKVLLIGADLRNPQIHTHINANKNTEGLSNYLHDVDFDWRKNVIKAFPKHSAHDVLLSGSIPPNPSSLLTNSRFEKLIEEAKSIYDYVIVDTAPTILVTDTMLISQHADVVIYITRANYTDKKLLDFSRDLNKSGKIKNMAYVLNGVSSGKSYEYNYGYGYGYGNSDS